MEKRTIGNLQKKELQSQILQPQTKKNFNTMQKFKYPINQKTWNILVKKYQKTYGRTISKDYKCLLIKLEGIVNDDLSKTEKQHYHQLLNTLPSLTAKNSLRVILSGLSATKSAEFSKDLIETVLEIKENKKISNKW
jgi:hypothetical protein